MIGPWEILFLLAWLGGAIPAYVVGKRTGVRAPGIAFVPLMVGPYIVILRSIGRSGWLCVLGFVPVVGLIFDIWLVSVVPTAHQRTRWWVLPFLIPVIQFAAFFAYAFTLPRLTRSEPVRA
jgi:hypothetical protein